MGQCYYCRMQLPPDVQLKHRLCPNCGTDLHACKNCVHYDENLSSKCQEPDSPWIRDRGVQNNCSYFEFRRTAPLTATKGKASDEAVSEAERAKERFRALFRTP